MLVRDGVNARENSLVCLGSDYVFQDVVDHIHIRYCPQGVMEWEVIKCMSRVFIMRLDHSCLDATVHRVRPSTFC